MDYMAQKATITGDGYVAVLQNLKESVQKIDEKRQQGCPASA
jgi:hypothetical protein